MALRTARRNPRDHRAVPDPAESGPAHAEDTSIKTPTEKAADAQTEKLRLLQELIADGIDDVESGRLSEWNLQEFLREAQPNKPTLSSKR